MIILIIAIRCRIVVVGARLLRVWIEEIRLCVSLCRGRYFGFVLSR
jgi:hypothetical protein